MMLGDLNLDFFLSHICEETTHGPNVDDHRLWPQTDGSGYPTGSSDPMSSPSSYSFGQYNEQDPVDSECREGENVPHPLSSFFMLGMFMVLMPILLMNLLIGLAVGDIESVRRNAQLKRLAMQVCTCQSFPSNLQLLQKQYLVNLRVL